MRPSSPVIPAVLASSLDEFKRRLEFCRDVSDSTHIDVMDGQFVNERSLEINRWPALNCRYAEAHLMVTDPLPYFDRLKEKGVIRALVHVESNFDLEEVSNRCRQLDLLLGFVFNPGTDLLKLSKFLNVSRHIQIMGVYPGRTSQRQLPQTIESVNYLRRANRTRLVISVDGGVSLANIAKLKEAGANYFISSAAIYNQGDWRDNFERLEKALDDN